MRETDFVYLRARDSSRNTLLLTLLDFKGQYPVMIAKEHTTALLIDTSFPSLPQPHPQKWRQSSILWHLILKDCVALEISCSLDYSVRISTAVFKRMKIPPTKPVLPGDLLASMFEAERSLWSLDKSVEARAWDMGKVYLQATDAFGNNHVGRRW